ncbi:MAG TPA: SDR family oxidoreductase [Bacteroidales bacterium]|mgnify:CR=1 FL=1|nr:SDR family oxidoreductase [Bacteroidales bacterium]HQL70309.1 SDR family oxidoreductase [Bacteroidales bacterium]
MLLKGKKGIIFGVLDENSIAWHVARRSVEEGAMLVLSNTEMALRLGKTDELAQLINAPFIAADAVDTADIENLLTETMKYFGGEIDFILHSIGMSPNVRKQKPYYDLDYSYFEKTLDVSALSLHKILQSAWKLDALNTHASVVALSYIAAQRTFSGYGDMAEAKALLESVVRSFGYHYGKRKKVRINSVSQAPTQTTAGSSVGGFANLYAFSDKMAPLGNPDASACADFCVTLFSDYTRGVSMQNLFHDGGYSSMGMGETLMDDIKNCITGEKPL